MGRRGECGAEPQASSLRGSQGGWDASWAVERRLVCHSPAEEPGCSARGAAGSTRTQRGMVTPPPALLPRTKLPLRTLVRG